MPDDAMKAAVDGPAPSALVPAEASSPPASTRPFPMSIGEEIFAVDFPDEPLAMHLEVRVSGVVDESRLEGAVAAALARHPMSRARMIRRRFLVRAPLWEIGRVDAEGVLSSLVVDDDEAMDEIRDDFFGLIPDLREAPAIRILVAHRPGGDSIIFKMHHSLMDGIGGIRWVNSVARAYAGRPDPIPDIDPISARDVWAVAGDLPSPDRDEAPSRAEPRTVAEIAGVVGRAEPGYGIIHEVVPAERLEHLDPGAYGPETTVGDLLIAALHSTMARWNASRGGRSDWFSVVVPVNIRPAAWSNEVAVFLVVADANISSPSDRLDAATLVSAVSSQMRRIRSGPSFAKLLRRPVWARWLISNVIFPMMLYHPRFLPRAVKGRVDSIVFANLGRIDRKIQGFGREAGGLTEFWASPPVTMPMGVAMDAGFLRGDLHLTLRYRRAKFDRRAAREFLGDYVRTLLALGRPEQ